MQVCHDEYITYDDELVAHDNPENVEDFPFFVSPSDYGHYSFEVHMYAVDDSSGTGSLNLSRYMRTRKATDLNDWDATLWDDYYASNVGGSVLIIPEGNTPTPIRNKPTSWQTSANCVI